MSKIVSIEEAFKREGLDAGKVSVSGIPERHQAAVIAVAKLFVGADHADGDGILDYTDYSQPKFSAFAEMGDPSGAGFAFNVYDCWYALSYVSARLSFKQRETVKKFFNENIDLFKSFMVYKRELGFLNEEA
ncbi:hypothetical protein ASG38_15070 [Flavobacterium sp. Leaf359]|uniref:hypothetical protein n=1 Tax=Flavobacterium sp. Leaf359 TaxID=1736351 RepID=UPI0006F81E01|nr:hypothetical protein [Flavobacterium sp. Leaf359]KQS45928.1 hypothetical protein ASG38_15070 [Flavobacterium sp. Leaf359]